MCAMCASYFNLIKTVYSLLDGRKVVQKRSFYCATVKMSAKHNFVIKQTHGISRNSVVIPCCQQSMIFGLQAHLLYQLSIANRFKFGITSGKYKIQPLVDYCGNVDRQINNATNVAHLR